MGFVLMDSRAGLGGYINDASHGGMQLGRATRLVQEGTLDWIAILVAEAGTSQRPEVLKNTLVVDQWRVALNPYGGHVGVWVVHGDDPLRDAQHYKRWAHVDLAVANCEREYVEDPTRSGTFLDNVGAHAPFILSTNGNPAQRPLDYRRWEQAGALLATQAYWQFNVVSYLTPRVAHGFAYTPQQVNVGPSSTSWWYRIWLQAKGPPVWAQTIGTASNGSMLRLKRAPHVYNVPIMRGPDGGLYVTSRTLRDEQTGVKVGTFVGLYPDKRITPHISNETGDTGRPTPAQIQARVRECPTRKVSVGVFTLDNATDDELRAAKAGMNA